MARGDEAIRELVGTGGVRYQVSTRTAPTPAGPAGTLALIEGVDDARVLLLDARWKTREVEAYLLGVLGSDVAHDARIVQHVMVPTDILYDEDGFVGCVIPSPPAWPSLRTFLHADILDDRLRAQVAMGLCDAAGAASAAGLALGRLGQDSVLVEPKSGRVYVCRELLAAIGRPYASDQPYELVLHVFALLHEGAVAELEDDVWGAPWGDFAYRVAEAILRYVDAPPRFVPFAGIPRFHRSPFAHEPSWIRTLLERFVLYGDAGPMAAVARDWGAAIGAAIGSESLVGPEAPRGRQSRDVDSKRLGPALRERERSFTGTRSMSRAKSFWASTLACALMMGVFAMLVGFSPLEASLGPTQFAAAGQVAWQYVPAALAGCLLYDALLTRKGDLRGYRATDYCGSLVATSLFMVVPWLLVLALGGGL